MKKLTEGMRGGDLEDIVLPLISVDEYESKVDDDAVALAFYVSDHDAAHDLNRFIQKSPITLLDTDVSPAPDQHGYYLVFFELLKNDRLSDNVSDVIEEVSPLCKIDNWQLRIRGVDRLVPFSKEALDSHFQEGENTNDEVSESIASFLQPSQIESVRLTDGNLILEGYGYREEFEIVAFGPLDRIMSDGKLAIGTDDVGLGAASAGNRMHRRLGEGWSVTRVSGCDLLARADSEDALLVRKLQR